MQGERFGSGIDWVSSLCPLQSYFYGPSNTVRLFLNVQFWKDSESFSKWHSEKDRSSQTQIRSTQELPHIKCKKLQRTKPWRTSADHTSKGFFIYYQVYPSYSCSFWSIKKPFPSLVQCWDWRINVLMSDINLARRSNIIFPTNHCMENNGSFSVCRLAHLCTMSTLSCSFQVNQHRGEMSNPWAALASIRAGLEQPRSLQPPRWAFLISQSKQLNYPSAFLQKLAKLSLDELSTFILPLQSQGGLQPSNPGCSWALSAPGVLWVLPAPQLPGASPSYIKQ